MSRRLDLELLKGGSDVHVHQGPSLFKRHYFVDVVKDAQEKGLRSVVLKSHQMLTTDRAMWAMERVEGIEVFGSIVLNLVHGGLNPFAVDHALRMGAKVVWMPTIDTVMQKRCFGQLGGYGSKQSIALPDFYGDAEPITLTSDSGELTPGLIECLKLIKQYDAILAVGHVTPEETLKLVREASKAGLTKIVVDHPYLPFTDLADIERQQELVSLGATLNYAYSMITPKWYSVSVDELVRNMKIIGPENIVLSSDLGQLHNQLPAEGLRCYVQLLLEEGITEEQIEAMFRQNTARLLYNET
ncbi:MAG: hypothetical protein JW395_1328 [Nitrospira sp.]|nr:hypothetical protein [Nitrospira sp.]